MSFSSELPARSFVEKVFTPYYMPTITKELRAGLQLLAAAMPEDTCLQGERISGRELLQESPLARAAGGKAIDPRATYRRLVPKGKVNHGRRLVRAYERGGRAGVLAYCQQYIEPAQFAAFSAKLSKLVPA